VNALRFVGYAAHARATAHFQHHHTKGSCLRLYLSFNRSLPLLIPLAPALG